LEPCSCSRRSQTPTGDAVDHSTLIAKLANFDAHAVDAVFDLVQLLLDEKERLIALARERHIWGHHTYGDGNFREWSDARLNAERDQEVADWIVYRTEELRRRG
jgi:hypothetical protein